MELGGRTIRRSIRRYRGHLDHGRRSPVGRSIRRPGSRNRSDHGLEVGRSRRRSAHPLAHHLAHRLDRLGSPTWLTRCLICQRINMEVPAGQ